MNNLIIVRDYRGKITDVSTKNQDDFWTPECKKQLQDVGFITDGNGTYVIEEGDFIRVYYEDDGHIFFVHSINCGGILSHIIFLSKFIPRKNTKEVRNKVNTLFKDIDKERQW
jgi:hypothetical protein